MIGRCDHDSVKARLGDDGPVIGGKTMARLTKADVLKKAEDLKNWGKWGPDDELGVLNYVTPEDIVNAAKLVRKGKVFRLGLNLDENGPQRGLSADAGTRCTRCWRRAPMPWPASTT